MSINASEAGWVVLPHGIGRVNRSDAVGGAGLDDRLKQMKGW